MKKILVLFAIIFCVIAQAQSFVIKTPTFIGKTQDEITTLNKENKNTFSHTHADSSLISLVFQDPVVELDYEFWFSKDKLCVAYSTQMQDKKTKEEFLKEVEKKCSEKIADKAWVQKLDGKNYVWTLQGGDSFFTVNVTQSK